MSRHPQPSAFAIALLVSSIVAVAASGPARSEEKPENDPNNCSAIWKDIGIPKSPGETITTVCHLGYITGNNDKKKGPSWVIERLSPDLVKGKATRENQSFKADGSVPTEGQAAPPDYDGSGFDQGHNAPAADFAGKQEFLDDTFFLSNAVPQVGIGFNRSIWRTLETQVRGLVGSNHPVLYVITGSIFQGGKPIKISNDVCKSELELPTVSPPSICPENRKNKKAECPAGVAVPAAMFKVIYNPASQTASAVLMENENHTGKYKKGSDYIRAHKVGLATVEQLSGLTFFPDFPARKQRLMRSSCVEILNH